MPEVAFTEAFFQLRLRIFPTQKGGYEVSNEAALILLYHASKDRGAFDLAAKVCADNLYHDRPLPAPLRLFASEYLMGMCERPKGVRANKTRLVNWYKYVLILRAAKGFGLHRTRGDNNDALSACDALSQAFERAGHHVDYTSLKRLCVEKRYQELRDEVAAWSAEIDKIGVLELQRRFNVPELFFPHVSESENNSDTT